MVGLGVLVITTFLLQVWVMRYSARATAFTRIILSWSGPAGTKVIPPPPQNEGNLRFSLLHVAGRAKGFSPTSEDTVSSVKKNKKT